MLKGDFNGDRRTDIALVRRGGTWTTVPVAFAKGDGGWTITNVSAGNFPEMARQSGVEPLVGDFNNDQRDDIALVRRSAEWNTIPIAFAQGNGGWTITNLPAGSFPGWAGESGVAPVVGDFDNDQRDDIALVKKAPGSGWTSVPVAFALGSGNWNVINAQVGEFAAWASTPSVTPLLGDFNADGRADFTLVRQTGGWAGVPTAFAAQGYRWSTARNNTWYGWRSSYPNSADLGENTCVANVVGGEEFSPLFVHALSFGPDPSGSSYRFNNWWTPLTHVPIGVKYEDQYIVEGVGPFYYFIKNNLAATTPFSAD